MTLVVPTSSADPGRAARPVLVETPTAGAEIARFGEIATRVGTQIEADRLDRQMKRLQVDMTRDLNDLRLEVAQIGDPDLADQTWEARLGEIRESYNAPGPDGRPRVDPRNAEDFGLAFEELANRHAYALGAHTLAMRQSEREATYLAYAHEATRVAATADEATVQEQLLLGYEQIDARLERGDITAAEAQREKMDLHERFDNARAIRMINEDPEEFLSAAEDGGFPGLSGEQVARYKVQAGNALEAQADAAGREAEAAAKEQDREIGESLRNIRDIAADGRKAVDETFLQSPEAQTHPDYAMTMAALSLRDEKVNLATMTQTQIEALITNEEARSVKHAWQTERLQVLEAALAEHEAGYEKDPIAYGKKQGLVIPALPAFDAANPGAYVAALEMRADAAADMVAKGYTEEARLFSGEDRTALAAVVKNTDDPTARLVLARTLAAGLGGGAGAAAAEITDDPVFTWATTLAGSGAPDATLRDMMAGQGKISDKTARMPTNGEAITAFDEITGGEFRDQPQLRRGVLNSALALYAEAHPDADPADFDQEEFAIAVNRALGAEGERGGMQTIDPEGLGNIFEVPLPPNVSARRVGEALSAVADDMDSKFVSDDPFYEGGPTTGSRTSPSIDRLSAAVLDIPGAGKVPYFGDPAGEGYDPAGIFRQMQLEALWATGAPTDQYTLFREVNGSKVYLTDQDKRTIVISLKKLMRATGR